MFVSTTLKLSARHALCVWALLFLGAFGVHAQQPGEQLCGRCKTSGKVPFEVDSDLSVEHEHGPDWAVLYCSYAIESDNMGLDWSVCPRCKTPSVHDAAQLEWDALETEKQAWLTERKRVEKLVDLDDIVYIETTHFGLTWNIPKVKADRKTYRMHDAAHLFAQRLEDFYTDLRVITGLSHEDQMVDKHYLFAFEKGQQAVAVGPAYAGLSHTGTVKRSGGEDQDSVIVTWRNKSESPTDDDFHRSIVHNMVHQITATHRNTNWFPIGELGLIPPWLNDDYGWLDAGIAHWFERRIEGNSETYCFREQEANRRWGSADWRRNVWKGVSSENWPSFAHTISKPTQSLTPRDHQYAWSWVDFLMWRNAGGFGEAMKLAKLEKPTREILPAVFKVSMLAFEEEWAAWVSTQYAPSNKNPEIDPVRLYGEPAEGEDDTRR
ncbi:MAG: hypothetical protein DHS20C15_14690 [Planctomycetota bacterium]|nr:MAG: hypothetical protein DHS20C15_14690 [Planctomycetota bacterium]